MSAQVDELKPFRVAEAYCYDAGATNAAKNLRSAVAALIAERDALREALKPFAAADLRKQGWPKAFRDQVIKARAALTTGESA